MAGRSGRIGLAIALLGVLMPLPAWAGSAQATLTVGVVVQARCALRVPGSLASGDQLAGSRETVAMRCTKGSLPSATGSASPSAVGPRITRDLVTAPATPSAVSPRTLSEAAGGPDGTDTAGPRLVVTVNF